MAYFAAMRILSNGNAGTRALAHPRISACSPSQIIQVFQAKASPPRMCSVRNQKDDLYLAAMEKGSSEEVWSSDKLR